MIADPHHTYHEGDLTMFPNLTKHQLMTALYASNRGLHVPLGALNGNTCAVLAVEREDGSGRCFNVRVLWCDGAVDTIFVRTID